MPAHQHAEKGLCCSTWESGLVSQHLALPLYDKESRETDDHCCSLKTEALSTGWSKGNKSQEQSRHRASGVLLQSEKAESLILGNKELAVHLKMTRRRIYWVPRSSGGLVNLGLDVDDDMVSGLSYKTITVEDGPCRQQVRDREAPGRGKYDAAWKTMIPFRLKPKFPEPQPLDDAGLFSYLTLSWLSPLMVRGLRRCLDENNIPQLSVHDAADKNAKRLHLLWEEEVSRHGIDKASVFRVMLRFQRTRLIFDIILSCCFSAASVLGPMLVIPKILEYTENSLRDVAYGVGLCLALFFTECLKSLGMCSCWVVNQRTAIRFRAAVFSFAFEKLMQFKSLTHITMGEAISFFTSDINYLYEGVYYGPLAVLTCLLLISCTITSCLILGPTALIATLCYLLILPLQIFLTRKLVESQNHTSEVSDQRIRVTSEVLTSIKLIKMYSWEKPFTKVIKDLRNKETKLLEKCGFVQSLSTAILFLAPSLSVVLLFLTHTGLRLKLTTSVAFTTVATLSPMRLSVFLAPFAVKGLTNARSAADRFKVSGQRSDHTTRYSMFSFAFSPMTFLLSVTPGQAESSQDGEGPSNSVTSCSLGWCGAGKTDESG